MKYKKWPIAASMIFSHILIISLIPHKEPRFSLTVFPLIFMQIGYTLAKLNKSFPRILYLFVLSLLMSQALLKLYKSVDYRANF